MSVGAPTNLVATPDNAKVDLDWDDNGEPDLASYNVYRSTAVGGPYTKINGALVATSTYTDTGLTNGTAYYYVVTAENTSAQESGNSNEASATPQDFPPAAPTGLTATTGHRETVLDWSDNTEPDLAGYNIYRSTTPGGPYTKINGPLVATSTYADTGLTNGAAYYYVVTAQDNGANESGYSSEVTASPTCAATTFYLHNIPTPPTGDTNSQVVLQIDTSSPTAVTLYNYDINRDSLAGLFIAQGGVGAGETDPGKHQVWRSGILSEDRCVVGDVTVDIWGAIKVVAFTHGRSAFAANLEPCACVARDGDLNGDGNVDLDDFAGMVDCSNGPRLPIAPSGCVPCDYANSDLDADGYADLRDFAEFAILLIVEALQVDLVKVHVGSDVLEHLGRGVSVGYVAADDAGQNPNCGFNLSVPPGSPSCRSPRRCGAGSRRPWSSGNRSSAWPVRAGRPAP